MDNTYIVWHTQLDELHAPEVNRGRRWQISGWHTALITLYSAVISMIMLLGCSDSHRHRNWGQIIARPLLLFYENHNKIHLIFVYEIHILVIAIIALTILMSDLKGACPAAMFPDS